MQDAITLEQTFPVSQEHLWQAITDPHHLAQWFSQGVELDLRVGGEVSFTWQDGQVTRGIIEAIEAPHTFVYRWDTKATQPGEALIPSNSTLVRFELQAVEDGTQLTIMESGFAGLPEAVRAASLRENTSGWSAEMRDLQEYLAHG